MTNAATQRPANQPILDAGWHKQIFVVLFSNVVCTFDFVIYLYLSTAISTHFFPPSDNALLGQLQVLALFSAGFLSRPIGALFIGRYGDIHGRKPALLISLSLFALATSAIAFLPTYAQIGIWAPLLLVIARLAQGIAFGSQMTLGWVFIAEHAPKNKMAIYSALATASLAVGNFLALIITKLISHVPIDALPILNTWRLPFIIGGILSCIALLLWRNLGETSLFLQHQNQRQHTPKYLNLMPSFKRHQAILLTLISSFIQVSLVMVTLLLPKFISLRFSFDSSTLVMANAMSVFGLILGCVYYGWLADRVSIGKAMMGGSLALIVQALAFYVYLTGSNGAYILPMCLLLGFCSGVRALCPVIFVQLFPTAIRLTSVSVTFNCMSALIGSSLPIALFYATSIISVAPGLYLTFIGVIAFILGLFVYNTPGFSKLESVDKKIQPVMV